MSWNKYKKRAETIMARQREDGVWLTIDDDGNKAEIENNRFEIEFELAEPCAHVNTIPWRLCDDTWVHWCADCGAISSESADLDKPEGPWSSPGDFTAEDVAKIRNAAKET